MTKKKSGKTMRLAGLLLVLVLVTSCFVGGTFAKYVTSGEATDTARVAKFGVEITTATDTMFKTVYAKDDVSVTSATITNSVESSNTNKLVAPGTKEDNAMTFSVKGTPEVAVKVDVVVENVKDVFLKAGSYKDYTKAPYEDSFTLAGEYHPVVFTLTKGGTKVVDSKPLSEVETYLEGLSKEYAPNTDLSTVLGEFTLSWEWKFENGKDEADTLLGNLAADSTNVPTTAKWTAGTGGTSGSFGAMATDDYSTNIEFKLKLTVTQID